jgi:hypothetical protein
MVKFSLTLLFGVVCCALLVAAHSHDGHDHHGHSHGDDAKPSFKYSKQANEQPKEQAHHGHGHDCHGHSHGEPHKEALHQEKPKTKDVPVG